MRTGIVMLLAASLLAESVAGLNWTAPAGWVSKGPAPMRAATYAVQDAECVVYFFGQGQVGKPADGLPVTNIDVTGIYSKFAQLLASFHKA